MSKELDYNKMKSVLDDMYHAALSCICHCYDNTNGFFPDDCNCEQREKVQESINLLNKEHKESLEKIKFWINESNSRG